MAILLIDDFVRRGGESAPFPLDLHTPSAGGTWGADASNWRLSVDGIAVKETGSGVLQAIWSGTPPSADYDLACRFTYRTGLELSLVLRGATDKTTGLLIRLLPATNAATIQDAYPSYADRAGSPTLSSSLYTAGEDYLLLGSVIGTTYTLGLFRFSNSRWLNAGRTAFDQVSRTNAISITVATPTAAGKIGLQNFYTGSSTTGLHAKALWLANAGEITDPTALSELSSATAVTLTAPSPASGANGAASGNWTVGADGIISGTIVVTPNDSANGGTFTPSTISISSGSPTGTFTYTPASAGNKSIAVTNNGGLSNPSSINYTSQANATTVTLTAPSPASGQNGIASGNWTVGADGIISGTVIVTPNDSANGGTFLPSTVSISAGSPTGTFTYTPASAGNKSIAVTNNGGLFNPSSISYTSNAVVIAYLSDSRIAKSPQNWCNPTVSTTFETVYPGSYFRLSFTGTGITINVDVSGLSAYPWVSYFVDSSNRVSQLLTNSTTSIVISGLADTQHDLLFVYNAKNNYNQANTWNNSQKLVITSLILSGSNPSFDSLSASNALRTLKGILYGDSITAGLATDTGALAASSGNAAATSSYAWELGNVLDAEFDQCGCGSNGWTTAGVGSFPSFPNEWNLIKQGVSRDLSSYDFVTVFHGYNDGGSDISQSIITNWLTAFRAVSSAWVFIIVPFSGRQRNVLTSAVAAFNDAKVKLIDLGNDWYQNTQSGLFTTDNIHPNSYQSGRLAAEMGRQINYWLRPYT